MFAINLKNFKTYVFSAHFLTVLNLIPIWAHVLSDKQCHTDTIVSNFQHSTFNYNTKSSRIKYSKANQNLHFLITILTLMSF